MPDNRDDSPCSSCAGGGGLPSRREFLQLIAAGVTIAFVEGVRAGSEARYPIPPSDGVTIDKKAQVIIVRYQSRAYAFNLACPHQNQMLRWLPKEGRFQCPKHESRYQPNGTFIDGRATRNMDRLAVRIDGGQLAVDLDKMYQSDKDPAGWAAAAITI